MSEDAPLRREPWSELVLFRLARSTLDSRQAFHGRVDGAHANTLDPLVSISGGLTTAWAAMDEPSSARKRGRPSKYATSEEKARADVDHKRMRRRKEAHERRERAHAQYYGVPWSPTEEPRAQSGVQIILENPGKSERITDDVQSPSSHVREEDDYSSYGTEDDFDIDIDLRAPAEPPADAAGPELCEEQSKLVQLVLSGVNVFYTGGAGTGKSTVLRAIVKALQERRRHVHVVTPTGISALNVGGSTYFTYAGWNPSVMKKPIKDIETMAMSKERRLRIQSTDVLIIDEISMLESNQFRRLDRACRAAHRREKEVFGGIQIVVTGDFYQLPPVKPFQTCFGCGVELKTRAFCPSCEAGRGTDIYLPPSLRPRKGCFACGVELRKRMDCPECGDTVDHDDQWAFRSDTWSECDFHCISLSHIHRQSDPIFIDILNALRVGEKLDAHQLSLLSDRESDVGDAIELSPVRREVDQRNLEGFQAIHGAVRAYRCQDFVSIQPQHPHLAQKAEFDADGDRVGCQEHRFPALLEAKFGMPVILLANIDPDLGLVNGSQGRIVGFSPHGPLMTARQRRLAESGNFSRFEEHEIASWVQKQPRDFPLPVVRFENNVQRVVYPVCQDTELGDPPPFSVVARTQMPLLPAWAITIHKSQGMTLEKAIVNLESIFEPQMAYVALSRVRNLKGLRVVSDVSLDMLQERGRLGGGNDAVRAFMTERFGAAKGARTAGGTTK